MNLSTRRAASSTVQPITLISSPAVLVSRSAGAACTVTPLRDWLGSFARALSPERPPPLRPQLPVLYRLDGPRHLPLVLLERRGEFLLQFRNPPALPRDPFFAQFAAFGFQMARLLG